MLFWWKNFEDGKCPSSGLFAALYSEFPELSLISYVKPIEKYFAFEPRIYSQIYRYSQDKLTTLRCENRKIQKKFKNQTNGSIRCRNLL
jgi:hypothetical protein